MLGIRTASYCHLQTQWRQKELLESCLHCLAGFDLMTKMALSCAVVRRCRNAHEARETYKTLKDQNIGGAAESADLYCQWASLEIKAGLALCLYCGVLFT